MDVKIDELRYTKGKLILNFLFNFTQSSEYEFAYYLYQDGKVVKRVWYQSICVNNMKIMEEPIFSGAYQYRLFIKFRGKVVVNELSNKLWIDVKNKKDVAITFNSEKVYFSDLPVKYILQQAEKSSPYLIISFSGLYSTEFQGGPPVYNHIRTLDKIEANKLFILDSYKEQFCYYVGFGGTEDYERSVIALIFNIANRLNIKAENIIATGSSKGGSAALYYSLKYYFGKAIIGAPQIYISKYLEQRANSASMIKRYYRLLGNNKEYGKKFWNNLILNQVKLTKKFPEMHFHVGEGDFHYEEHMKPLFNLLDKQKVKFSLDLKRYNDHSQTGIYFTPFLQNKVEIITSEVKEKHK